MSDDAPKKPRKAKATDEERAFSEDGHVLIGGARWHYPKQGEPSTCAVEGCSRILGLPDPAPDDDSDEDEQDEDASSAA